MMKRERYIVWSASLTAVVAACGCTAGEEDMLGTFVCDFLRSALAAFLF